MLLEKMLEILAAMVSHAWRCPLVGLLLMIAISALLSWRVCTPRRSHRWVVRKGGVCVLWECIVWHHTGLSTPPRA